MQNCCSLIQITWSLSQKVSFKNGNDAMVKQIESETRQVRNGPNLEESERMELGELPEVPG